MGLVGCELEPASEPRDALSLVDHDWWVQASPAMDPYVHRRPQQGANCDAELGFSPESFVGASGEVPAFEIDTGWCNFLTVEQPALADLRTGEQLRVLLWHYELLAPEPSTAYVALALEGQTVWDETVLIPNEATLIEAVIPVDQPWPEGSAVQFHVDNHGANTWELLEIVREPAL